MSFKVEAVPSPKSILGEGPHWDEQLQSLFYNDIYGTEASILRYDFKENKTYSAKIDGEKIVGFIIPVANTTKTCELDEYAVGICRRVGIVHWDGKSPKALLGPIAFEVEDDKPENRFNDAKADPVGRFYGGTMRQESKGDLFDVAAGTFYKYIKGDGVYELLHGIYVSNGMAWNESTNKFYYIDSCKFNVREYDWDPSTGDISNERIAIDFKVNGKNPPFIPDGMTIDTDGNLYVATYGGSKVLKVDPKKGKIVLEIPIPARQVTSVCFGGPNLDILYVTSASAPANAAAIGLHPDDKQSELDGRLFKVTGLGVKGFPGVRVRV
ncbi:regucalcin-like [Sitodiplosis mosellana]|uniref:regucalcin-like n=1 Tax=Sitodiplosis mosellana TaxID=263140 RepID=UPI0024452F36|nr:regucalcin-like [Sitodiplosis mosellana]